MANSKDGGSRPFRDKIDQIRTTRKLRYSDLANESQDARSSAWFNKLITGERWDVSPPDWSTIDRFAALMGTTHAHVCQMIAEEWYGVIAIEQSSSRVRELASRLDALEPDDYVYVERLVMRLLPSD